MTDGRSLRELYSQECVLGLLQRNMKHSRLFLPLHFMLRAWNSASSVGIGWHSTLFSVQSKLHKPDIMAGLESKYSTQTEILSKFNLWCHCHHVLQLAAVCLTQGTVQRFLNKSDLCHGNVLQNKSKVKGGKWLFFCHFSVVRAFCGCVYISLTKCIQKMWIGKRSQPQLPVRQTELKSLTLACDFSKACNIKQSVRYS